MNAPTGRRTAAAAVEEVGVRRIDRAAVPGDLATPGLPHFPVFRVTGEAFRAAGGTPRVTEGAFRPPAAAEYAPADAPTATPYAQTATPAHAPAAAAHHTPRALPTYAPAATLAAAPAYAPAVTPPRTPAGTVRTGTVSTVSPRLWRPDQAARVPGGAPGRDGAAGDVHLRVDPFARQEAIWRECADVLAAAAPVPGGCARARVTGLLGRYPGCLVAAVPEAPGRCVLGARGGAVLLATSAAGSAAADGWARVLASFLHGWLVAGGSVASLRAVVLAGPGGAALIRLTPV